MNVQILQILSGFLGLVSLPALYACDTNVYLTVGPQLLLTASFFLALPVTSSLALIFLFLNLGILVKRLQEENSRPPWQLQIGAGTFLFIHSFFGEDIWQNDVLIFTSLLYAACATIVYLISLPMQTSSGIFTFNFINKKIK